MAVHMRRDLRVAIDRLMSSMGLEYTVDMTHTRPRIVVYVGSGPPVVYSVSHHTSGHDRSLKNNVCGLRSVIRERMSNEKAGGTVLGAGRVR